MVLIVVFANTTSITTNRFTITFYYVMTVHLAIVIPSAVVGLAILVLLIVALAYYLQYRRITEPCTKHCTAAPCIVQDAWGNNIEVNCNLCQPLQHPQPAFELITKYDSLREAQRRMTRMFCIIDRVCRDNNIEYMLEGGSLIGALRHGGWVPWDGDGDLCMRHSDYARLLPLLKKALKEKYGSQYVFHDLRGKTLDVFHGCKLAGRMRDNSMDYSFLVYRGGIQIDFFIFKDDIMPLVNSIAYPANKQLAFDGALLMGPRDGEAYIKLVNQIQDYKTLPSLQQRFPHESLPLLQS